VSERRPITSTYRLQLHAGFDFAAATDVIPYLADLGISHLYLSPVLTAAPGSTHGYDVVDHTRISAELGGPDGLRTLAERAHDADMGVVVDVVPNHMAVPTPLWLNRPLWETVRAGRESEFAEWFDIDWDLCEGRLGLPLLADPLTVALETGDLTIGEDGDQGSVVRYREQTFPIRAGTESGSVEHVLAQQHYLLACWREKDDVLGYRRFFDVDTLIGVRVELPQVFASTHEVLIDLYREGWIDGFRIDHPDGLADPQGYLEQLRNATDGAWVVVEKILSGDEQLPRDWATAGTTGYDALARIQAAIAPPTATPLDELWRQVVSSESASVALGTSVSLASLAETERAAKTAAIDQLMQPEVRRLVRRAVEAAQDHGLALEPIAAKASIEAMLPHVETYRAYLRLDVAPSRDARTQIDAMTSAASADRPELVEPLAVLNTLLLDTASASAAGRDVVVRFQQVCGPVMAKGVEDTTFYRWHRFVALNEVGGDPRALDDPGPASLDEWSRHQQRAHPDGMTTLSTHDTKRDEDVRARLHAAGEQIEPWTRLWSRVSDLAETSGVDPPTAYLLMQTLVGAWPISEERLAEYAAKAIREAKLQTSWAQPQLEYEKRVVDFVETCLSDGWVTTLLAGWVRDLAGATQAVQLGQKLVQLTMPGVPDVYQGTELVQGFLVDPDNRRSIDFGHHAQLLSHVDSRSFARDTASATPREQSADEAKLWVTSRALRLRRDLPQLFGSAADYTPISSTSPCAWGFVRAGMVATLVQRWPHRLAADGFGESTVALPSGDWIDALSSARHTVDGSLRCADAYRDLPVALLVRQGS
jgi:(1->4)-alpha-D-glucan 1-alpha-D-glucosylmutase